MKINRTITDILYKVGPVVLLIITVAVIIYNVDYSKKSRDLEFKSRFTFTVTIDEQGNVCEAPASDDVKHVLVENFADFSVDDLADIWIREFTAQYTRKYVNQSKTLRDVVINESTILDAVDNIAHVSFKAVTNNSEQFTSWDGVLEDGVMVCDWVVKFLIDSHSNNTATIFVEYIMSPEDYGMQAYNKNNEEQAIIDEEKNKEELAKYEIKNNTLSVTYDGGVRYYNVPVDIDYLMVDEDDVETLKNGSYYISTQMTAFAYGGSTKNGKKRPVSVVYTTDMGENWINCEIDTIYTADYCYIDFVDNENGIFVVGYTKNEQYYSKIYSSKDFGETWESCGAGFDGKAIKGVKYVTEKIGFISYKYEAGMETNLFMTNDGGRTFEEVILPEQELDSTASIGTTNPDGDGSTTGQTIKFSWKDIYKEATVPVVDNNVITVYLTQGDGKFYNDGKTAAKYQSSDNGKTWKYIGQFELSTGLTRNIS